MSSTPLIPSPHLAEIEAIARDYIEGWYTGDVERMDRALHDELVKRIPGSEHPGSIREVTKKRMLDLTAQGGGELNHPEFEILVDDVATDIATVRLLSPEYLDYLHIAKTSEGWKIVNVLFHTRD
jgi:hypothetical protein